MSAPLTPEMLDVLRSAIKQGSAFTNSTIRTEDMLAAFESLLAPIPIRLCCEGCGHLHLDEGDFATKPHDTHVCQNCGMTWKPSKRDTVGVQFLPGYKNEREPVDSINTPRRGPKK